MQLLSKLSLLCFTCFVFESNGFQCPKNSFFAGIDEEAGLKCRGVEVKTCTSSAGKLAGSTQKKANDSTIGKFSCSVKVAPGEIISASLSCNLRNLAKSTTYMRVDSSGPVVEKMRGNWIIVSGSHWGGGVSNALFRANKRGLVTLYGNWHVSSGVGEYGYCNLVARSLGKEAKQSW